MKAQNNKPTIRCEPFTNKPIKQHMHIVPKPKNKLQQNQAHHHVLLWVIQIGSFNSKPKHERKTKPTIMCMDYLYWKLLQ